MSWQLQRDMLVCGALRLRLHRIALAHWRAGQRLRSWGVAPLHRDGEALLAPSAPDEALWLGAWTEDGATSVRIRVQDPALPAGAEITLPADFQLTALADGAGRATPLNLPADQARRTLRLELDGDPGAVLPLALLAPAAWAQASGRPAPAPLSGPPPLPARLG